jgi:hypothetical protein
MSHITSINVSNREEVIIMDYDGSNCPCKRVKCERHGNCAVCMEHHHSSKRKLLTACERLKVKEEDKKREK